MSFAIPKNSKSLFDWLSMRCNSMPSNECENICENIEGCASCRYATYSRPEWNTDKPTHKQAVIE